MGHKVNPISVRIGVNQTWRSRWFSEKNYKKQLLDDIKLRAFLEEKLAAASVDSVEIERSANMVHFIVTVARPGVVIGRGGVGIEELTEQLMRMTQAKVKVDIREVEHADRSAQVVADGIARQIERRISYRRAMKQAIDKTIQAGALGIKIKVAGRLNGAEIARREWDRKGSIPLHTLRSDLDYALATARTTYGCIGIKVWIYKGEKRSLESMES